MPALTSQVIALECFQAFLAVTPNVHHDPIPALGHLSQLVDLAVHGHFCPERMSSWQCGCDPDANPCEERNNALGRQWWLEEEPSPPKLEELLTSWWFEHHPPEKLVECDIADLEAVLGLYQELIIVIERLIGVNETQIRTLENNLNSIYIAYKSQG
ncbi:hypothetical protein CC1G_15564 [Coprinopsis cinerea okayama7|uniref:Uncharacterized protein n=1 Tax=Coprinopsis cinerea (strain Okayama-7 / 130 / ATCC MYA-4618 / FGSC 9003) TaxID=240176 RepID=D6RN66_COPC7|nr:hypothetical protein CC1G_15564 [Coprinopsis cinerea okayama7\|eukprot:XP_002911021.1 hypothetical protein CC1G_15564 [Coprinopsis cinerea okayama7\